jgi:transcription elongation factor GreA
VVQEGAVLVPLRLTTPGPNVSGPFAAATHCCTGPRQPVAASFEKHLETSMAETWLSQEAYDRLRDELETLKTEGRPHISGEIEVARAHGDLRENAEYHAAKDEQGKMEARIRQLEALLRDARIGQPEDTDAVRPGLVVELDVDGDDEVFLLGSREDSHDELDILSAQSPMGTAILGCKPGDSVTFETPNGTVIPVTVKGIRTP